MSRSSVVGASGQPVWDLALELLKGVPPGRLLDAGAGGGSLAARLVERGFQVTGFDLVNQWQFPDIAFVQGDLDDPLPFAAGAFEVVTWIEGLGFVDDPSVVLREFHRVLRPEGVVAVTMPNVFSLQSRLRFFLNGTYRWFPHPPYEGEGKADLFDMHRDPLRLTTLCFHLRRAGFDVERIAFGGTASYHALLPLGWLLHLLTAAHNALRKGKRKKTPPVVNSTPALLRANVGVLARRKD